MSATQLLELILDSLFCFFKIEEQRVHKIRRSMCHSLPSCFYLFYFIYFSPLVFF